MDLRIRQYLSRAQEKRDAAYVRKAWDLIKASAGASQPELSVVCAEESLQLGCWETAQACLTMFLEGDPPVNQFLCRAHLCQAQLVSSRSINTEEELEKAVMYYLKAVEIAKDKPRYHFLVFNASVLYVRSVRLFLQPGRRRILVSSLAVMLRALEEVNDPDLAWRAQLMLHLVECLLDAGTRSDAAALAKVTAAFMETHKLELYPRLFSIQVRHELTNVSEKLKDENPSLLVIYKMQKLKRGVDLGDTKRDDAAALREIFLLLTQASELQESSSSSSAPPSSRGSPLPPPVSSSAPPSARRPSPPPPVCSSAPPFARRGSPSVLRSSPPSSSRLSVDRSSIPLNDRAELLLELAFLSLQLQELQTASDCLTELRHTDVTVAQQMMLECVQCELDLRRHTHATDEYSRSSVERRVCVVGRLDALLQSALKNADARTTQAVCVCLWNTCLPLLQHNLRKRVRKPLHTLARALESTDSALLAVLCRVLSELACVSEQDEDLISAEGFLQKALLLDPHCERLRSSLRLLQLRSSPHSAPAGPEQRAALLIHQAEEAGGRECAQQGRVLLVCAGVALAPQSFQAVLNADGRVKDAEAEDGLPLLAAKAQHHMSCVQEVKGHLTSLDKSTDDRERVKLWASLAKSARRQEVFDVCRAACRFCLLYDDGRWTKSGGSVDQTDAHTHRDLLRLLAEIHFINAEVTILKLRSEGVELNGSAVPPDQKRTRPPEDDAHWSLYSDWIKDLSAYATGQFLRGAELGAELSEAWLVTNAAVYLFNYSSGALASRGHRLLLPAFRRLLELLQQTGHDGELVLCLLLCDAVVQGLIQPWCVSSARVAPEPQDAVKAAAQPPAEKTKKVRGKSVETSGSTLGPQLEPAAAQDIRSALEVCEFALKLSNGNAEPVPIIVRQKLLSSWVSVKQLLQQQIGLKLQLHDQSQNEALTLMSHVLVAVEMLQCNRSSRLMEFTVPALSELAEMACVCQWSDALVELYVWTQLSLSAHHFQDQRLVLTCSQNALQLEQSATHRAKTDTHALVSVCSVQEMLSSCACVRGQALLLLHGPCEASLRELHSAVSFAEQAGSRSLCVSAAGRYWTACGPLMETRDERRKLRETLELILRALTHTRPRHTPGKRKKASGAKDDGADMKTNAAGDEDEEIKLWVSIVTALVRIHEDNGDWRKGLELLDQALRETHTSTHTHRLLFQERVLLKARSGVCVLSDVESLSFADELSCAQMWRCVSLCAADTQRRRLYFHKAIAALQSPAVQWQRVDLLLEFAEWLYSTHTPVRDVCEPVETAVDVLQFTHTPSAADVGRLQRLLCAHTLLSLCVRRSSHTHRRRLLSAHACALLIWKVSMMKEQEVTSIRPAAVRSSSSRKDRDDKRNKQPSPVEDKARAPASDVCFPVSLDQWIRFRCPEEIRQTFASDAHTHAISSSSLHLQRRTLHYLDVLVREMESVSLTPLTFAPLHLSEVIARDLLKSRSRSDLYRLRIIRSCADLGLESVSPYFEDLQSLTAVPEDERMRLSDGSGSNTSHTQSLVSLWLEKADECLRMKLLQPAHDLLTLSERSARELGDHTSLAKSLQLLADLANQERRWSEAEHLLEEAQAIGGDEDLCFRITHTLLTNTAEKNEDTQRQVCELADQACRTFRALVDQRPSRASVLRFYSAALQARGAVLRQRLLSGLSDPPLQMLTSVCDALKHASEELLELGYNTHAADAMLEHAHTLRILSAHAESSEEKQRHLLLALSLMRSCVCVQDEAVTHALDVLPPHESGWRGLPSVRVCVRLRLALCDLALLMHEMQCSEQHRKWIKRNRKCSVERALEDYLRSSSQLSQHERDWAAVGQTLSQEVLTNLSCVHSLSLECVETRARALALMGRCLRLSAQQRDPLRPHTLWARHSTEREEDNEQEETMMMMKSEDRRAELQGEHRAARRLWAQASECLCEALSLSLHQDLPRLLPAVCEDLLECHGQLEPSLSGQFLALLQSAVCCVEMSAVLRSISSSVSLASDRHTRENSACSQLSVSPEHLRILGDLPPVFRILLLQHSHDRSVLYGGFYEKAKAAESQKGKSVTGVGGLFCSRVVKASVQPSSLLRLHTHLQEFRRLNKHTHLRESQRRTQAGADGKLEESFRALLEEMELYLWPVLSQLDFTCFSGVSPSVSAVTSASARDKDDKPQPDAGECVVILADRMLLEFPLEALSVLQQKGISSISRDFSLQLLHSRLQTADTVESDNKKEAKGVRGVKGRGDQSRSIKAVIHVPPPHSVPADTRRVRYMVDVQEEDEGERSERFGPAAIMRETLHTLAPQFTAQWEGLTAGVNSVSDVEQMLSSCSSFIYSGVGSFFSIFPPHRMASISMSGCQMVLLFDCGQNRVDVQKRRSGQVCDGLLASVCLLSLSGVRSVLLNQWHSSSTHNALKIHSFIDHLLNAGLWCGRAAHVLRSRGSGGATVRPLSSAPAADVLTSEDVQRKTQSSSDFNLVVYGLPNVIVS